MIFIIIIIIIIIRTITMIIAETINIIFKLDSFIIIRGTINDHHYF